MVRATLFTSLVAAAYAAVAAAKPIDGAYVVELEDGHDHSAVLDHLGGDATTRMHLNYELFRGLSFQLHDVHSAKERAEEIRSLPAVKNIWPIQSHTRSSRDLHPLGNPDGKLESRAAGGQAADHYAPHVMSQIDKLRAKGVTGKGIKVAIVDSGIDYTHPALGHCYGKDCLVSFGHDFVGDAWDGTNDPVEGNDPMDCSGLGTFVAGIVAAQANPLGFTGVAPGVTLGAYKVSNCLSNLITTDDLVLAAFNKAYEDGADIIATSMVEPTGWSEQLYAVAASRIAEKGVPCILSAGMDGNAGLFYAGMVASGKKVTAVATYDSVDAPLITYESTYNIDGAARDIGFTYTQGSGGSWGVSMPLYATSLDPNVVDDACKPLPASTPDLSKFVVLVRRGTCLFDDKISNLVAKGAKHVMFYNDSPGTITVDLAPVTVFNSTGMVAPEIGLAWINQLKAGRKITVNVENPIKAKGSLVNVPNNITGGGISTSSSWGPTWDMEFKPQFGAVGTQLVSTWPVKLGSYAISGPRNDANYMVAGIVALITEVRGKMDPELMTNLLSSTAKPQAWNDGTNFYGELAPAPQQGGGMVQAYDAAYTTSLLSPSSLSFNDTAHLATNLNFTVTNKGQCDVTYKLGQVAALTMYALDDKLYNTKPFPNDAVNAQAVLTFTQNTFTLPPGHSTVIGVTAKPATEGVDPKRLAVWSGYISINGTDDSVLSLPYQGLTGSLKEATVLHPDRSWVITSNATENTRLPDDFSFVLPPPHHATDSSFVPTIFVWLSLGSRLLRVKVLPVTPGVKPEDAKPIGIVYGSTIPWNTKGWNTFNWDGRLMDNSYAPAGHYQFATQALRLFGDESKEGDWDTAYTQPIFIKYQ
ncbi:hypothetical protein E4U55_000494 [Claviceps digitariae]|nr:hypothetical protein E4U55_000494 [Claviceps digitariae]